MKLVTDQENTSSAADALDEIAPFGIIKVPTAAGSVYLCADRIAAIGPGELVTQSVIGIDGMPAPIVVNVPPHKLADQVSAARMHKAECAAGIYFDFAAEHADNERAKTAETMKATFGQAVGLAAGLASEYSADEAARKAEGREPVGNGLSEEIDNIRAVMHRERDFWRSQIPHLSGSTEEGKEAIEYARRMVQVWTDAIVAVLENADRKKAEAQPPTTPQPA